MVARRSAHGLKRQGPWLPVQPAAAHDQRPRACGIRLAGHEREVCFQGELWSPQAQVTPAASPTGIPCTSRAEDPSAAGGARTLGRGAHGHRQAPPAGTPLQLGANELLCPAVRN